MKQTILTVLTLFVLLLPQQLRAQERAKVALVLGGGGAKGAAHVGVLKYIEQEGLPIDMVVGTSIGSIVGGLYAIGYQRQELDSMFRTQRWSLLLTDRSANQMDKILSIDNEDMYLFGFHFNLNPNKHHRPSVSNFGAFKGDSITALLHELVAAKIGRQWADSCNFDQLPLPFRAMAFDVRGVREVTLREGCLSRSMRASMSIPLLYKPVPMGNMLLIDGGVMDNLPVDVARQMGADYIIAIDLSDSKDPELQDYVEERVWTEDNCLYIHPDLTGYNGKNFTPDAISQMIRLGEAAGAEAMSSLRELHMKVVRH